MTEPLFRFLVLRPPLAADPLRGGSISLAQDSDFQKALLEASKKPNPRDEVRAVAIPFIASAKFVGSVDATDFQKLLVQLGAHLDLTESTKDLTVQDVEVLSKEVFNQEVKDIVASKDFGALLENLRDSILAIKFVQEDQTRPIEALTSQLRDLELLKRVAATESNVVTSEKLQIKDVKHDAIKQWASETDYKTGDQVSYNGMIWECLQSHHSLSTWIPPDAPSLWKVIQGVPPNPTPPEVSLPLYRKRNLLLPFDANLKPAIAGSEEDRQKAKDAARELAKKNEAEATALLKKHGDLEVTVQELVRLNPEHLQITEPVKSDPISVDEKYTARNSIKNQVDYRGSLRSIAVNRASPSVIGLTAADEPHPARATATSEAAATPGGTDPAPTAPAEPTGAFNLATALFSTADLLRPKGGFEPMSASQRTPRVKGAAFAELTEVAQQTLKDRKIDLQSVPLNVVVQNLRKEQDDQIQELKVLAPDSHTISYSRFGDAFISAKTPIASQVTSLLYGTPIRQLDPILPLSPTDGRIPHTKGNVQASGVADLLVVKQTLKGYQAADIAHVENVLKGESKSGSLTKTTRTETTIASESETTTSDEHELVSTTRFEMSKEASNTIKEDESLKAGLKVSAKYGPVVSIDASAEGSVSRSKEEVNKSASKYGQDITDRTSKKIAERALDKRSTITIDEVVEKTDHGINNATGTGHISGVYQFLNKVYEAQVFNYGLRTMYDFMVPEPAAFLTAVLSNNANAADASLVAEKPATFTISPAGIQPSSIGSLITSYQATDVLPPPEDYTTISDQSKVGGGDHNTDYDYGALISIPSGYEAIYVTVNVVGNTWQDESSIDITVAGEGQRLANPGNKSWSTSIINHATNSTGEGGSLAWAFNTYRVSDCVVTVTVLCRITARRWQQWQNETHAKLLTAYKARLSEYEEKVSRLKLEQGVTIQGTNPTANLEVIKTELKKNCISILTAQHYELFNSIEKGISTGLPQINLYEAEAEGQYVRFFEEAFEWDQIMYVTYPYFWGRSENWKSKFSINDPDPVFDEFLKSGFARVVVPARRGFEGAIDHFIKIGDLWNGKGLPTISDATYIPIADELSERLGGPENEVAQGAPWDVIVPTTLVKLRADDKLPTWHKDGTGKWIPDV